MGTEPSTDVMNLSAGRQVIIKGEVRLMDPNDSFYDFDPRLNPTELAINLADAMKELRWKAESKARAESVLFEITEVYNKWLAHCTQLQTRLDAELKRITK